MVCLPCTFTVGLSGWTISWETPKDKSVSQYFLLVFSDSVIERDILHEIWKVEVTQQISIS